MAAVFVLTGCSATEEQPVQAPDPFTIIEGVQQITVTDAEPGVPLTLYDPDGTKLITLITDKHGQAHFAYVPSEHVTFQTGEGGSLPSYDGATLKPGKGYRIVNEEADPPVTTRRLRVLAVDDVPSVSLYERQKLDRGMNYLEMRDGTRLSAAVWIPDPVLCGEGPWPTIVEYSGYDPSNTESPQPGSQLSNLLLCYVAVGVNMRGTGCSGGVFDVFNTAQHADGYDIIETVARQWFVKHGKVGMVGLSYPGISQLYVAYTNPPHLAAIAPMSVIEDPWMQAWPGGIYNSGFTRQWIEARDRYAKAGGESWTQKRIDNGDAVCQENQKLRLQNIDFKTFSESLATYPADAAERRLSNLVGRIDVPVFLTGAWQDEQTGSRFATMLDDFTGTTVKRFTMFNGRHPDGYTPLMLTRWAEFLSFYVAKEIPQVNPAFRVIANDIFKEVFGFPEQEFEGDRFLDYPTYEAALAAYESEAPVRVLFESGFGSDVTEAPKARFEMRFPAWPPKAEAREWYLGADGKLLDSAPTSLGSGDDGIDHFWHDPLAGDMSYIYQDEIFHLGWRWEWSPAGYNVSYLAEPFAKDTIVAGNGGYVDLWFASEVTDATVEVSILEVRDGVEYLVQTGVFALKHRMGVDEKRSGEFLAEYTYAGESVEYLTPGEFVAVKVPILPFSHAFRAGSQLRLIVNTPGRDAPWWEYLNPVYDGPVMHSVARTAAMPSKLKLPVVASGTVSIPDPAPPCYALRGVVCRDFYALPNTLTTD
jgi:predicted acyl esterase